MYPPDADKKEKRGLRKRAKYFVLFGGKLQYVGGYSVLYNNYNYAHAAIQILFVEEREHCMGCFQLHQWKTEAIQQLFNWRINLKSSSTASS